MSEVVDAEVWPAGGGACALEVSVEGVGGEVLTGSRGEEQSVTTGLCVDIQVLFDRGHQVRRDRDLTAAGAGLRRPDHDLARHPHHSAADMDHSHREVDV